jgi:hypothetical protein
VDRAAVYAKAVAAGVPTLALVLTALVQALTDAAVTVPTWLVAAAAVATTLAVYAVPNRVDRDGDPADGGA